ERRAQALSVDQAQLRDLIGDAELRELLDVDALEAVERELQHLEKKYRARSPDQVHDLLLTLGDLTDEELAARTSDREVAASVDALERARRVVQITIGHERRYIAVEDAARYRDTLDVALPDDIPEVLLESVHDPLGDLAR